MDELFDDKNINSGRQIEWDFAKVFAIVLMVGVHYFAFCSFGNVDYGKITDYMFVLAQCSAPIFMFAMGIGMVYTRHNAPKEFIIRGFKLLILGLIVNIMYFLSNYGAGVAFEYSLLSFFANDILQFAGLSFIVIGLFKRFNFRNMEIFFISVLFSLIASYCGEFTFTNMYLNQFLGNFVGTSGQNIVSCFPVLNWFVIPVCGMIFAEDLIKCRDKDELYKRILKVTAVMDIVLLIVGFITLEGMFSSTGGTVPEKLSYLHLTIIDIIILIVEILFVTSILYFISKRSSPKFINFIKRTSKNLTIIYIIQWALILSLTYINQFLHVEANLPIAIVVFICVVAVSILLADAYVKIRNYFKIKKYGKI